MGNMAAVMLLTAGLLLAQGGGVVHQEDLGPPGGMAPEREEPHRETPAPFVEAEPVEEDEEEAFAPSEPPEEPEPRDEPETLPQPRPQPRRSVPAFWFVLPN